MCLGSREHRLDPGAVFRRYAVGEVAGIDAEPGGQVLDRVRCRPGLSELDLTDVLLGEADAGYFRLRKAERDAPLTYPLTQPDFRSLAFGCRNGMDIGVGLRHIYPL